MSHTAATDLRPATTWLAGERLVALVINALVWMVVARLLGPSEYGALGYATAAGALALPGILALQPLLVQKLAGRPSDSGIIAAGWRTALVLSLISFAIPLGFAMARASDPSVALATAIAGAAVLFGCFTVGEAALIAAGRVSAVALARLVASMASAAGRLALAVLGVGAVGLALVSTAQFAIVAVGLFTVAGAWAAVLHRPSRQSASGPARHFTMEGWPLFLAGLAVAVYMSVDVLMLGLMTTDEETGLYSVAVRLVEATYLVPMALMTAASVGIAQSKASDNRHYQQHLGRLASLCFWAGVAMAAVVAAASWPVIHLVVGPAYRQSFWLLLALLPGTVFVALGVAQTAWIVNESHTKFQLVRTACGGIVNVMLNLVLIPLFGAFGAALSTVLAYAVSAVLSNAFYAPARPYLLIQLHALDPRNMRRGVSSPPTSAGLDT